MSVADYFWLRIHLNPSCEIYTYNKLQDCATFVQPSSVSDHAGNGLYAMKPYAKGSKLPMTYPGVYARSDQHFDELNDYLVGLCNGNNVINVDEVIGFLFNKWNIVINKSKKRTRRRRSEPNWDQLYDSFIAYRFGTLYWNVYDWDGMPDVDPTKSRNAALFFNEPPPYERFVNRMTNREQDSRPNVRASVSKDSSVCFYAKEDIEKGDELLFNYGPLYLRRYEINPLDGPRVDLSGEESTEEKELIQGYLHMVETYQPKGRIFKRK